MRRLARSFTISASAPAVAGVVVGVYGGGLAAVGCTHCTAALDVAWVEVTWIVLRSSI